MRKTAAIFIFLSIACSLNARTDAIGDTLGQIHFGSKNSPLKGLTITWRSQGQTDSIKWGYTETFGKGTFCGKVNSHYHLNLFSYTFPDLLPDTSIYYSIYNSFQRHWADRKKFITAAASGNKHFTFTVLGDSRTHLNDWHSLSSAVCPSDFSIFVGDIVSKGGSIQKWDNWFNYGKKYLSQNLVYHTPGNHEYYGDPHNDNYLNLFTFPGNSDNDDFYYSFHFGKVIFICLNSEDAQDSTQYKWLIRTLENNKSVKWKFVWFHRPFYTSPSHEGEMDKYFGTWWKAFDDYGVDLIFNGHTHNYQRTIPINRNISFTEGVDSYGSLPYQGRCQIVTGGAGAPLDKAGTGWFIDTSYSGLHYVLVEVSGDTLNIKALTQDNSVIDKFSIVKKH